MESATGIVLNGHPYGDYGLLAVVFTENHGLLKFALPYQRASKNKWQGLFQPLQEVELQFASTLKEVETVKNASLLSSNLQLRNSFETLEAASLMAQALIKTQVPGEASPALYALFKRYLSLLPEAPHPKMLLTSFRMKLLMHEGLLDTNALLSSEQNLLIALSLTTSVQHLLELPFDEKVLEETERLFESSLHSAPH